jgi:hypothetical protein
VADYTCRIVNGVNQQTDLIISVSTNGSWSVVTPRGWCPSSGDWNASDLIGRGGCLCYGGGPKHPEILKLDDFKPYGYERYKPGVVGQGTGRFIAPMMPVVQKEFKWDIASVTGAATDSAGSDYSE